MVNKTEYWEKIYECDQCYIFSHKDEIHKIKIKKWQRYVTIEIFKNTLLSLLIKNHHIFPILEVTEKIVYTTHSNLIKDNEIKEKYLDVDIEEFLVDSKLDML